MQSQKMQSGDDEDDDFQVYRVSQNFLKQYKPMIQSKSSKYNVTSPSHEPIGQSHQPQQVVISKKKLVPNTSQAQISHSKHMTSFQSQNSNSSAYNKVDTRPLNHSFLQTATANLSPTSYKDSLVQAIATAATKNVSVFCDGKDIQLVPPTQPVHFIDLDLKNKHK